MKRKKKDILEWTAEDFKANIKAHLAQTTIGSWLEAQEQTKQQQEEGSKLGAKYPVGENPGAECR